MGVIIRAEFIINDEDFEIMSFIKRAEIIANLLVHPDWAIDLVEVGMDNLDGVELENKDENWSPNLDL